jgi:hypothetical protein
VQIFGTGAGVDQDLPREYRIGGSGRRFLLGLVGIAGLLGVAGIAYFLFAADDLGNRVAFMGLGGFFVLLGVPVLLTVFRTRVILSTDAIETRGIFIVKRMERGDTAGRRRTSGGHGPPIIQLLSATPRTRGLKVPQFLATDATWDRWFESIPDIDASEKQAALKEFLDDPDHVGSNEEKLAELAVAQRVAQGLLFVSLAAGGWAWFHPHPYAIAIGCVALLPWITIAIAASRGGAYRLNPARNDVAANLSAPVLICGAVLMIRAMLDVQVVDWQRLAWVTAAGTAACALILVVFVAELRKNAGSLGLTSLLIAPYAFGLSSLANVYFDDSEGESYAVKVADTRISHDKSTHYYLRLEPWGPRTEADEVDVGREFYGQVSRGDTVCVYVHRGAFAIRWFYVDRCSGSTDVRAEEP